MIKDILFNDKRLGDLFLDFSNEKGEPYSTIVLAGENGCGKTTILELITNIFKNSKMTGIDTISHIVDNHVIHLHNRNTGLVDYYTIDNKKDKISIALNVEENDSNNIRWKGFVYSKARSGFNLKNVSQISAKDIDSNNKDYDDDDYTDIRELLIDIDASDSRDFQLFVDKHPEMNGHDIRKEFDKESRISRFKFAFNSFFETIKFDKVGNPVNNSFPIYFNKHGNSVDINQLSTGEKQIVCRGGRLLKNVGNMNDGIVLIDEPELSLHPIWQKKILDYYCDLFTKSTKQIAQVIVATHSEYVIESALKKNDCLVIILKDNSGTIEAERITAPDLLGDITIAEINYKAFNVYSIDYHNELYSYYQQKVGTESSIEKTDDSIFKSPFYDQGKHSKQDSYKNRVYKTLPTYIRNATHHRDSNRKYTPDELKESTELLRQLCK